MYRRADRPSVAAGRRLSSAVRREIGLRAARSRMFQQDKVWSKYSNDKVDIAHALARVIRSLHAALPPGRALAALSIGSSNEPQFRILESMFRDGLHLLDIEEAALAVVAERVRRQGTDGVRLVPGDFTALLKHRDAARRFRRSRLGGKRMTLVTLHHSLYYAARSTWPAIFDGLVAEIAAPAGSAIHAVLMKNRSADPSTTTWLYNHFAGRFCGAHNDQDLRGFARELRAAGRRVLAKSTRIEFRVDDFELLMGAVWMILLYPNVHHYTREQRVEIIEHVYEKFWLPATPLAQVQDHVAVYRGRGPGLL